MKRYRPEITERVKHLIPCTVPTWAKYLQDDGTTDLQPVVAWQCLEVFHDCMFYEDRLVGITADADGSLSEVDSSIGNFTGYTHSH